MAGGQMCAVCMAMSDSGMALKPCARSDCPQALAQKRFASLFMPAAEFNAVRDVRFRGKLLSELTHDEAIEALRQALTELHRLNSPAFT